MTPAKRARPATEEEMKQAFEKQSTSSEQQAKAIIALMDQQKDQSRKLVTLPCTDMTYKEVHSYRIQIQNEVKKLGKKYRSIIDPVPSHSDKSRLKTDFTIFFSTEKLSRKKAPKE